MEIKEDSQQKSNQESPSHQIHEHNLIIFQSQNLYKAPLTTTTLTSSSALTSFLIPSEAAAEYKAAIKT